MLPGLRAQASSCGHNKSTSQKNRQASFDMLTPHSVRPQCHLGHGGRSHSSRGAQKQIVVVCGTGGLM